MAGEGQGPFCPTAKYANTLIASESFLAADIAAVRYMGLYPNRISYLRYFIKNGDIDINDIFVYCDKILVEGFFTADTKYKDFILSNNWETIKWQGLK
jgi:uncharacterized protein (DUF362 family)